MKRIALAGCLLIAGITTSFAQPQDAGDTVDVSAELQAKLKCNDTNSDDNITWKEVLDLHDARARDIAEAAESQDPEKALASVNEKYASRMFKIEFLLADADRDLTVTSAELKNFLVLSATRGTPKPEIWHHEQLARDWVDTRWATIVSGISGQGGDKISRLEMVLGYPWIPDDADWNLNSDLDDGIQRPEGPSDPSQLRVAHQVFKDELQHLGVAIDGHVDREQYIKFKARERMRGWWVDEVAGTVDVRDEYGVLLASSANAVFPSDVTPIPTEGMKPGSSWTCAHKTFGEGETRTEQVRHEVAYMDGVWASGADVDIRRLLKPRQQFCYRDGQFFLVASTCLVVRRKVVDGKPGEVSSHSTDSRSARTVDQGLEEITVPGGTFACWKATHHPGARVTGASYKCRVGGISIEVLRTDAEGNREVELISLDK